MLNLRFKVGEHCKVVRDPKTKKVALMVELNESNVYASESATYANLTAIETKDAKYGKTHFIKVSGQYDKETKQTTGLDFICGNIYEVGAKAEIVETSVEVKGNGETDLPF